MLDTPTVVVVNESQITDGDAWNLAWALDHHAKYQLARAWKIGQPSVLYLPRGKPVPAGAWILHLVDTVDVAGALGYHDEDGNEVPYGRVAVKTTREAGDPVGEVAGHELDELLLDPHVNLTAWDQKHGRLQAFELGDPCQGNPYDVGKPDGHVTGIQVADFVLPGYFDENTPADTPTSFTGALKGPFALGPQGYVSYTTSLPPSWQQQVGAERTKPVPEWDDRLSRRS